MVIFLNGSINAGKSTVARLLADKLQRCALLEIDAVREMIAWMPLEESIPVNLENAEALIRNFVGKGLHVVVPYPLSRKNYDYMAEKLKDLNTKIYVFTLAPSLEKAQSDTEGRKLTDWERERIAHHYAIGIPRPDFGTTIDTTHQTPEETAEHILSELS